MISIHKVKQKTTCYILEHSLTSNDLNVDDIYPLSDTSRLIKITLFENLKTQIYYKIFS
jgi:hypothetical protein